MSKSQKIRDAFASNPDAKPAAVAKKFSAPISMVYRLRKEVQSYIPVNEEIMKHFATTTDDEPSTTFNVPPGAGTVETSWTTTSNDQGDIVATLRKNEIEEVLRERGDRYGPFENHAKITQMIKDVMRAEPGWDRLTYPQREALEMVAHKIGRMLNGDPTYEDNVVDILGYTDLMLRCMRGKDEL